MLIFIFYFSQLTTIHRVFFSFLLTAVTTGEKGVEAQGEDVNDNHEARDAQCVSRSGIFSVLFFCFHSTNNYLQRYSFRYATDSSCSKCEPEVVNLNSTVMVCRLPFGAFGHMFYLC